MRDGNQVGQDREVCTIVAVDESWCRATFVLPRGRISAHGLVADSSRHFDLLVTGGSGAYSHAEGWLHDFEISRNQAILTFHLSG
jgi:hypothetical protein